MNGRPDEGQLWAKGLPLDQAVHRFTVGEDPATDLTLVPFDALGSAAHALTLVRGGWLEPTDGARLVAALEELARRAAAGGFTIAWHQEDGHTALEAALVAMTGEAGKRIHLGRSRNDQVILATRLMLRDRLTGLGGQVTALSRAFAGFAESHGAAPLPGYTHLRRAMPSSLGQWSAAFAESLLEELDALEGLYRRLDRCPAGAAAGFGAPVSLDRAYTASLLGFSRVQRNPVDVQNSRGRHEVAVVQWLAGVASALEKFLWDVALYSTSEFGFLRLPDAFTTGSSIMPHKRNPDVVELARGACRELRGQAGLVEQLATGLPSNYHRDTQLLKAPLIRALARAEELVDVLIRLVPALEPVPERLAQAATPELWAAHEASARAAGGETFRDAYRAVAREVLSGAFEPSGAADSMAGRCAPADLAALITELKAQEALLARRSAALAGVAEGIWRYAEQAA